MPQRRYLQDAGYSFLRTLLTLSITIWAVPVACLAGYFSAWAMWEMLPYSWFDWLYEQTPYGLFLDYWALWLLLWWPIVATAAAFFLRVESIRIRWCILVFLFGFHFLLI